MKLIRDGYDAIIDPKQLDTITDKKQLLYLLHSKLEEEILELAQTDYKDPEEYGDVIEVLRAIAKLQGVEWTDVRVAKAKKFARLGGFSKGLLWHPEESGR